MLANIAENFLLGFAISAVPGAVFFETVRRALRSNGVVISFLVGNFSGMLLIILTAFLGLSAIQPDSLVARIFYIFSGLLLIYIGTSSILANENNLDVLQTNHTKTKFSGFLTGFILAVANPLSIAFWVSLSAKLLKDTGDISLAILNSVSVILGAVLLFAILISFVKNLRVRIKPSHLVLLSRLFGLFILAYGLITLGRVLI